jgi:hypothetical protein
VFCAFLFIPLVLVKINISRRVYGDPKADLERGRACELLPLHSTICRFDFIAAAETTVQESRSKRRVDKRVLESESE